MQILHILDHSLPLHSGYSFRTANILCEQQRRGWKTHQLTGPRQTGCTVSDETAEGLHFHRTPAPTGLGSRHPLIGPWLETRQTEQRLLELATRLKPDILHAHSPVLDALPALRVARRLGLPVVYEIRAFWEDAAVDHGTTHEGSVRYRATRALETWVMQRVDHLFTICEGLRHDILARGIPPDKVTVIPNAVDIEHFQLASPPDPGLKRQLGLDANARILGFIGSFYAYEGLDLLLDALPHLLQTHPDIRVLLVGGGPQEGNLKAQAQRLGLADRVVFTGRVPHTEVNRYYDLVDLLVYPRHSMRLTELVTPLKPLEAMAQGRLLVASDVGGHRELIRNGETGQLFAAGNVEALAQAIRDLLAHEADWSAMRQAGRRFVEQERNWTQSVAHYADPYRHLIERASRSN